MSFVEALRQLPEEDVLLVAREARPTSDYIWETILPDRPRRSYYVSNKAMSVKTTMAGMVGMDSPYTPGGAVSTSTFLEQTTKLSLTISMGEQLLREIQDYFGPDGDPKALAQEALNFYRKVCIQGVLDRMEWMRGEVLRTGVLDWTYNGLNVNVDYGIPAANILTLRTIAGTDAYHLAGSGFWEDVASVHSLLKDYNSIVGIAHPNTIDAIVSQPANNIVVTGRTDNGRITLQRWVDRLGNPVESSDYRDRLTLVAHSAEGEYIDTSSIFDGTTTTVPFCKPGFITWVASGNAPGYRLGDGATTEPRNSLELGFTHIAPTVEGGGSPGIWGRLYTPEYKPWQLVADVVANMLPVIETPERIVIASTEMA